MSFLKQKFYSIEEIEQSSKEGIEKAVENKFKQRTKTKTFNSIIAKFKNNH